MKMQNQSGISFFFAFEMNKFFIVSPKKFLKVFLKLKNRFIRMPLPLRRQQLANGPQHAGIKNPIRASPAHRKHQRRKPRHPLATALIHPYTDEVGGHPFIHPSGTDSSVVGTREGKPTHLRMMEVAVQLGSRLAQLPCGRSLGRTAPACRWSNMATSTANRDASTAPCPPPPALPLPFFSLFVLILLLGLRILHYTHRCVPIWHRHASVTNTPSP